MWLVTPPGLTWPIAHPDEATGQAQRTRTSNFVQALSNKKPEPREDRGIRYLRRADRAVWAILGLAEWDKHVTGKLSPETDRSLRDMLQQQSSHGGYHVVGEVEIPYITTDYNLSVQAARAIASAPDGRKTLMTRKPSARLFDSKLSCAMSPSAMIMIECYDYN